MGKDNILKMLKARGFKLVADLEKIAAQGAIQTVQRDTEREQEKNPEYIPKILADSAGRIVIVKDQYIWGVQEGAFRRVTAAHDISPLTPRETRNVRPNPYEAWKRRHDLTPIGTNYLGGRRSF